MTCVFLNADAEVRPEDSFKFHYVFKGPKKDGKVKRLYYVYGTSLSAKDEGIKQEPHRPVGKGYNWPESYRKANNLYYELTFADQGEKLIPHMIMHVCQTLHHTYLTQQFKIKLKVQGCLNNLSIRETIKILAGKNLPITTVII